MTEQGLLDWLDILATKRYILDAKKAQFEADNAGLIGEIEKIEAKVKEAVLAKGETVKGSQIAAVWNKGKTSWDGKLTVSFRTVKE